MFFLFCLVKIQIVSNSRSKTLKLTPSEIFESYYSKMPKRKRSVWVPSRNVRARAARKIQKAFRRKRRYKTHRRPTVKRNARAITQLFSQSDPKYNLRIVANQLIDNNPGNATRPTFAAILLNDLAASGGLPEYTCRAHNDVQAHLKNIRLHFTVNVRQGVESDTSQRYYVALVKTTNAIGSAGGITMPLASDVFDATSTVGTLLAPWEGYRITQGAGSDILRSTTFLKVWTGYLSPQGGDCMQNYQTVTAVPPSTEPSSTSAVAAGLNVNYTQDRPSQKWFTYTHKCLNALVKFERSTSIDPMNVKYFLVALSDNPNLGVGFRLNASCKINFIDN